MAVLPSTARDKNVKIKNIHIVDNNIQGRKACAIKDRYFDDPAYVTPDNQLLLPSLL
ncbi:hypothetical protein OH492_23805 [Vibrio chagasii]|nr:hypothetical protein [Vibrio chagasii]